MLRIEKSFHWLSQKKLFSEPTKENNFECSSLRKTTFCIGQNETCFNYAQTPGFKVWYRTW